MGQPHARQRKAQQVSRLPTIGGRARVRSAAFVRRERLPPNRTARGRRERLRRAARASARKGAR
eukprot:4576331-Prymnesium_polylepis.2